MFRRTLTTAAIALILSLGLAQQGEAAIIDLAAFSFDGTAGSLNSTINPGNAR